VVKNLEIVSKRKFYFVLATAIADFIQKFSLSWKFHHVKALFRFTDLDFPA
jgi:hypothetical protein